MTRTTQLELLTLAAWLGACAAPPGDGAEATGAIADPTADVLPPGTSVFTIEGVREGQSSVELRTCHATLIGRARVLTAAHCFGEFLPSFGTELHVFGWSFTPPQVRFHPLAWADGKEVWDDARPAGDEVAPGFDLAIIDLDHAVNEETPVRLWSPPSALQVSLNGQNVTVAGHNHGAGPATGTLVIAALQAAGSGHVLVANPGPSMLQPGDSGGGVFLQIPGSFPSSEALGMASCTPPGAVAGERAIIGVNHAIAGDINYLVPLYLPELAAWAVAGSGDLDGDGVCNDEDNCVAVSNASQDNCNALAEVDPRWTSNGAVLGDACDPTPCAYVEPQTTSEIVVSSDIPFPTDDHLVRRSYGRAIMDELGITAVIEPGASETEITEVRFCLCRDPTGAPITDPAVCEAAPFYCVRDPLLAGHTHVEVGGGQPPGPGETYWHLITLSDQLNGTKGYTSLPYPGVSSRTWDYLADYTYWHAMGWVSDLPYDARFGAGTDLGGVLWIRSNTRAGNVAHGLYDDAWCGVDFDTGLPTGEVCSIGDRYEEGVAPDARTVFTSYRRIPRYRPAPWWTYCASCGDVVLPGDIVSNPIRFVTFDDALVAAQWGARGAVEVTAAFSLPLRSSFADASKLWIGASEPLVLASGAPRAVMLSADGTAALGSLSASRHGFGLTTRRVAAPIAARTGFAAAYSRTLGTTFVAGGTGSRGSAFADVWRLTGGRWTSVALANASMVPRNALASVYSTRDAHLWIADDLGRSGRVLRYIDPETGAVDTFSGLAVLSGLSAVYLAALEDGRVVLAGNTAVGHRVAVLESVRSRSGTTIRVAGQIEAPGALVMPPAVAGGTINVAVEAARGTGVAVVPFAHTLAALGVR